MNKRFENNLLGKLLNSSYFKVIFFSTLGSVLQVGAFYVQKSVKDLTDEKLAVLTFGIYTMGLLGYATSAIYNWVLLKLSSIKPEDRFNAVAILIRKTAVINTIITTIICAFLVARNLPLDFDEAIIISLVVIGNGLTMLFIYPQAIAVIKEKFTLTGLLALSTPILRTIFTLLFISNQAVWPLFLAFIVAGLLNKGILIQALAKEENKTFRQLIKRMLINKNPALPSTLKINSRKILMNILVQFSLAAFFGLDGIILKSLLSDTNYVIYTSYAFLYKFPLFISTSLVVVLTGKDIMNGAKTHIKKHLAQILGVSLGLISLSFGAVFLAETLSEGLILSLIGYGEYVIEGYSLWFGLAWFLNTFVYYLFLYLLKTIPDNKFEKLLILAYGICYVATLYIFSGSLFALAQATSGVAALFIVVNVSMVLWQGLKKN